MPVGDYPLSMNWVSDFQRSGHDSGWDLRMWVFLGSEIGGSDWGLDSMIRRCKPFVNVSLFVKRCQRAAARRIRGLVSSEGGSLRWPSEENAAFGMWDTFGVQTGCIEDFRFK